MTQTKNLTSKSIIIFALLLAFYEITTYLSNDAYLPALPLITNDLNTNSHLIQLTLTTWFMGSGAMQLFLGPISDRIGRRPILLIGGLVFIASTLACALTHNIYALLIFRFIQGATIASMVVPGYATIHELLEQKQAIHTLAIMSSITILAPAFGPLAGAFILWFSDWRWIFGILALFGVISVTGLFFNMPETIKQPTEKIQFKRILIQYKNIVLNKKFILAGLTAQCFFAAMIAWVAAGPFLLIDHFHFSTLGFGIVQALVFGSFILATRFVKKLMESLQLQTVIKIGLTLLLAGGVYALISSIIWPNILWNTIIAMMLLAGGTGLAFPILNRLAVESSAEPMGSRVAVSSFLMGVSSTLASAIVSAVYNDSLFSLAIVLFGFGALALILQMLNTNSPWA